MMVSWSSSVTAAFSCTGSRDDAFADFVANLGIHPPSDIALLGRVFLVLGGLLRTYAPRLDLPAIVAPIVIAAALQSLAPSPAD